MLEPILGPRAGMGLNLVGAGLAAGMTLLAATVTTLNGTVPTIVLAPLVAFGFVSRVVGCGIAASRGVRAMPWGARVASWVLFGLAASLLGFAGSLVVVAAFGAFVALDAAAGLVKRDETERPLRAPRGLWARVRVPLLVGAYLVAVAAFHLLVGVYLPYGTLITWTLLALLFAVAVRALSWSSTSSARARWGSGTVSSRRSCSRWSGGARSAGSLALGPLSVARTATANRSARSVHVMSVP